ncbi:hypothetical protein HYH03_017389 [Edaphochlamys debaryana]|uniref:Protein kinase domain-containing protein n=1 Tax=Edaphochlamys debaryana TaxID=47281 RepID=A0A835XI21_9CHLO|nr:hypothetical protein HYH03_017389 [Edaphochlamys debaryana]|eukprot:KAG2483794.1 hypothetical protein HYH03_017389 [Edaphochlamys debaryana]
MTENRRMYSNLQALTWLTQIASALSHLHANSPPIIHRDIKQENLLLKRGPDGALAAKLADLGLHVTVEPERSVMIRRKATNLSSRSIHARGSSRPNSVNAIAALAGTPGAMSLCGSSHHGGGDETPFLTVGSAAPSAVVSRVPSRTSRRNNTLPNNGLNPLEIENYVEVSMYNYIESDYGTSQIGEGAAAPPAVEAGSTATGTAGQAQPPVELSPASVAAEVTAAAQRAADGRSQGPADASSPGQQPVQGASAEEAGATASAATEGLRQHAATEDGAVGGAPAGGGPETEGFAFGGFAALSAASTGARVSCPNSQATSAPSRADSRNGADTPDRDAAFAGAAPAATAAERGAVSVEDVGLALAPPGPSGGSASGAADSGGGGGGSVGRGQQRGAFKPTRSWREAAMLGAAAEAVSGSWATAAAAGSDGPLLPPGPPAEPIAVPGRNGRAVELCEPVTAGTANGDGPRVASTVTSPVGSAGGAGSMYAGVVGSAGSMGSSMGGGVTAARDRADRRPSPLGRCNTAAARLGPAAAVPSRNSSRHSVDVRLAAAAEVLESGTAGAGGGGTTPKQGPGQGATTPTKQPRRVSTEPRGRIPIESLGDLLAMNPDLVQPMGVDSSFTSGLRRVRSVLNQFKQSELRSIRKNSLEWVFGLTGKAGSCMYMAPEVYRKLPYNEKADVFSFAVVMYELLARELLIISYFNTSKGIKLGMHAPEDYAEMVCQGYRPPRPECLKAPRVMAEAWELVEACWHDDPVQRPSMQEVVEALARLRAMELESPSDSAGVTGCGCVIS